VLALVAFVLGFLIFALWKQGRSADSEGASAPTAVVIVADDITGTAHPAVLG